MQVTVTIKNVKTGISKVVTLPMKDDDLLDATSDVLGRDEQGYILDGQEYCCIDETGQEVDSVFDLNYSLKNQN